MGDPYFGDQAKKFMHDQKAVGALTHSVKVEASMADAFDCVYLAGGHGCCVDFVGGAAKELKALVEAAFAKGKVVAADCHGPMGLLECTVDGARSSRASRSRPLPIWKRTRPARRSGSRPTPSSWRTSSRSLQHVFKKGDPWTAHVCKAGNLITAQNPQSADACAAAVIAALA